MRRLSDKSLQTHLQCGRCGGGVCVGGGAHITIDYCHVEYACVRASPRARAT